MTPTNDLLERPDHCAKFSQPILDVITVALDRLDPGQTGTVCDPFSGVGLIHTATGNRPTYASDLEDLWTAQGADHAGLAGLNLAADALRLPYRTGVFQFLVTSPCYGNRMADLYDGRGLCQKCHGHPASLFGDDPCERCGGLGRDNSKRYTYRISLGRPLTKGSAAGLQWGPAYRWFHRHAWDEALRVLARDGHLILNISDHYRTVRGRQERQHVARWHHDYLTSKGLTLIAAENVDTARMGNGANYDARAPHEHVLTYAAA